MTKPPPLPKPPRLSTYKTDDYRVFMVRRSWRLKRFKRDVIAVSPLLGAIVMYTLGKYILYLLGIVKHMN